MRVLMSGGTGYVGSHLIPALIAEGHAVAVIVRKFGQLQVPTIEVGSCIQELDAFCGEWRPDAIVHLAADVTKTARTADADRLAVANIVLPLRMVAAASEAKAKFFINITTFSTSVDGKTYSPQTLYAATKQACEDLLAYYHQSKTITVCNLAFYDVYGPGQKHARFLNDVIAAVRNQTPLSMSKGEQDICFLHVSDAVGAILHCLGNPDATQSGNGNNFSVYGPQVFKLRAVPQLVAEILGQPCPGIRHDRPYRKNEIMRFLPKYPLLTGWVSQYDFEKGIKSFGLEEK